MSTLIVNNDSIKSILECTLCLEVPRSKPIFQCASNGYSICGACYAKSVSQSKPCPHCSGPLAFTRPWAIKFDRDNTISMQVQGRRM